MQTVQILLIIADIVIIYVLIQTIWLVWQLGKADPQKMLANEQNSLRDSGRTFYEQRQSDTATITHSVQDGIERIHYVPKERRFDTPVLMCHGMWHAAWCWQNWQEALAAQGWESIAFSLPGHGKSPQQRPLRACTLDYYLAFYRDEVQRLPKLPILMGHSMGGALTQWYLQYVSNKMPAAVLVGSWVHKNAFSDGFLRFLKLDLLGCLMMYATWNATPLVRSPQVAARALISANATLTPQELHASLDGESALVLFQHSPPYWEPAEHIRTPMLVLAAEKDRMVSVKGLEAAARHYRADFLVVENAAHNLMMEHNQRQTIASIGDWLKKRNLA
jgi:pimeloyl-ACP methyl ester carboxylesterase